MHTESCKNKYCLSGVVLCLNIYSASTVLRLTISYAQMVMIQ